MTLNISQISRIILLAVLCVFGLTVCRSRLTAGGGNCAQYKYDSKQQTFVNAFNQPVACSLADNFRIFEYIPGKGCDMWRESLKLDDTVQFAEMVVRMGSSGSSIGTKYCVLQRFIEHDSSNQVMLINTNGGGAYCFRGHGEVANNYVFSFCDDVKRKSNSQKQEEQAAKAAQEEKDKKDSDTE